MKKILLTFFILTFLVVLSSCQIVDSLGFSKATIVIHNGDSSYEHEITIASLNNKVPVPTKEGYYLKGIYDSTEGGTKFFYGDGESSKEWQRKDSNDLYCQWGSLSEIQYESPVHSNGDYGSYVYFEFDNLPHDVMAAILGNPNGIMNVKISFSMKAYSYFSDSLTVSVYAISTKDRIGEKKVTGFNKWHDYETTLKVGNYYVKEDSLRVYFDINDSFSIAAPMVYVDEIWINITFS